MKPLALVIDDNPDIREHLQDLLDSMGHECHTAGSQQEASHCLKSHTYAYVLLDLELPVRYGRPTSIAIGKNLLHEIREDARNSAAPVLVITAHGKDSPNLAVELMKGGAVDFVNKPFHDLDKRIREALRGKHLNAKPNGNNANGAGGMTPFEGEELIVTKEGIDIAGVRVCGPACRIYRVLKFLAAAEASGKRRAFSGKGLADALQEARSEAAINEAVSEFRKKFIRLMAERNILAASDSVIIREEQGYFLAPGISVASTADEKLPAPSSEPTPQERQQWFLVQIKAGVKLRRCDFEKHFGISTATAKRDLSALEGQFVFVGAGARGYYRAKS